MNQLEQILNGFGMQMSDIQIHMELISLEARASSITQTAIITCSTDDRFTKSLNDCKVDSSLKEWFKTFCFDRIQTIFSATEHIEEVVPDDYVEDENIVELYDALINAEMNEILNVCMRHLAIACNDREFLAEVVADSNESIGEMFKAKDDLGKAIMKKEITKAKIITPTNVAPNNLIKMGDFVKK